MAAFRKFVGKSFFKLISWKFVGEVPNVPKYVCVLAPHTSIWDMIWGKMYNWAHDMDPKIMVKKEIFVFPLKQLISHWGGIPIDREYPGGIVGQLVDEFQKSDRMILVATPEGKRAANAKWKTGFYRIAIKANVPIYLSFCDFKSKTAGFMGEFKPTGNLEEDMKAIKEHYRGMEGLYKDQFIIE